MKSWDRRAKESQLAYKAFMIWLEQPNYPRIRSYVTEKDPSLHLSTVSKWAKRWDWDDRAVEYDRELTERLHKTAIERMDRLKDLDAQQIVIDDMIADYEMLVTKWRAFAKRLFDDSGVTAKDVKDLIQVRETLDTLGRRAAKLPRDYKDTEISTLPQEHKPKAITWGDPSVVRLPDDKARVLTDGTHETSAVEGDEI